MPTLSQLVRRSEQGEVELIATQFGQKNKAGTWRYIFFVWDDNEGDTFETRVWSDSSKDLLRRLSQAISDFDIMYLTTPSLDVFRWLLGEEREYEEVEEEEK